jgi:argininosuccinate lyase
VFSSRSQISAGVIATMEPRAEPLRSELVPEMLATDLAEFLVRKGVPFRETHHISGAAVKLSEDNGIPLSALTVEQLQSLHPLLDAEAVAVLQNYEASVELKDSIGGTSKRQVLAQVGVNVPTNRKSRKNTKARSRVYSLPSEMLPLCMTRQYAIHNQD